MRGERNRAGYSKEELRELNRIDREFASVRDVTEPTTEVRYVDFGSTNYFGAEKFRKKGCKVPPRQVRLFGRDGRYTSVRSLDDVSGLDKIASEVYGDTVSEDEKLERLKERLLEGSIKRKKVAKKKA
jgi:hypothetical protein